MKGARCSLDRQSSVLEGALGHSWRLLAARERSWRPPGQLGTFPQASKTLQDDLGGLKRYACSVFNAPWRRHDGFRRGQQLLSETPKTHHFLLILNS